MHGEYKVPGGKLVVVDLEVADGVLRHVRVAGDFFLEPDEALEAINGALDGAPADTDAAGLAARVDAALPEGTVMYGLTSEGLGIAVRRALAQATNWTDYDWQLVHEGPQSPALHMALDEVLTQEVAAGRRPPTLRVWEWASPSVIIGSFQSLANEVDPEGAARHGVDVVRRVSGGGAMFVEPGNTITYSLSVPDALVQGLSFQDSYAYLDDWVLGALADMGIKAWYQPLNDIATDAGKIAGAAQKRVVAPEGGTGAVLHHVTMSYDIDADKMLEVLRIGKEKMSDKGTKSAKKRVDPLRRQTGLPREAVIDRMIASFGARYGLTPGGVTDAERARAEELVRTKFTNPEWTARVP
ncbi:lipoate--protein ligase family protein [Streptomyces alfalfae]|uniref:Lipoate--protein ligase n=1 Tax=Streptomyces alfalfae TaxID=1642299 RepID=A0A1P8TCW0_9ACTN|nr:biotin/lipoate A/B protein ligase family protein [Streptomyces alfalfae]AYA15799.1 lipoate--protein ligase family protein [Streptomyces fradiae]APY85444.1 lipoate--protein ligase [Streptomyces alfalfae]QQC92196.1 lipoate--protein ligase family protein [Streptomyces alfalfae]QUI34743.1 lipoate--protein ligase family protein [Streptomyces alfalfae]RXX39276.1 lipoate--protein ligase family protein [Streptomyces alfalfae]